MTTQFEPRRERAHCCAKSRRWYNNARPLLFPTATYSLVLEKSRLVIVPSGVPDVGQLEKTVSEGRWTCKEVDAVSSDIMA